MERLTKRVENCADTKEIYGVEVKCHDYVAAAHRLADYEDTGLTPEQCCTAKSIIDAAFADDPSKAERIRELMKADKEGRLTVLPCKVGDKVFGFHRGRKTAILPMVAKWFETNTDGWAVAAQYVPMAPKFYKFSDFGKTVFLTREEAEKALEAKRDD